ncbi:hypothetical protein LZ578_10475 [Jeotgalibaca sp. MA1X17-3]|uniref:hypothetical protein n=1 Tax=Jeotgalibaca sp. MA1X17-3 TaxID=2908211 RepID=UPI001F251A18|nr:hypothetical protein [Jeotgalibaca sp. MA1X17-3]UJF15383.1 hypothetical protein LZ578_10475 [Jeotgalibaca sp. MA1X17-3]
MHKLLIAIALVGINGMYGNLSGEETAGVFDSSAISFTHIQIGREESGERYAEKVQDEEILDDVEIETEPEQVVQLQVDIESEVIEEVIELENEIIETETQAIIPTVSEEIILEEQVEPELDKEVIEPETLEEELTYDQLTQRDGEDGKPEPVPPEVSESWYVEETATQGLQLIVETYSIQDFSFVIDTCPSNYVYQYEFYANSPENDHVNLVGIYQYDATGNRTFQLNQISGIWE